MSLVFIVSRRCILDSLCVIYALNINKFKLGTEIRGYSTLVYKFFDISNHITGLSIAKRRSINLRPERPASTAYYIRVASP